MLNSFKQVLYRCIDVLPKLRNKIRGKSCLLRLSELTTEASDSEKTFYVDAVNRILRNPKAFKRFRRIYDYREILEHIDYKTGKAYLNRIQSYDQDLSQLFVTLQRSESIGSPRKFKFDSAGLLSPTTLRYVSVALEINRLFGSSLGNVVEIGGGYGGQAFVMNKLNFYAKYDMYDLPEVQELARRFLATQGITDVSFPNLDDANDKEYDLVISNYAFSEFPRSLQDKYLNEVLLKSARGYLTMNSGRENKSGRSTGKYSLDELIERLPPLEVMEEVPKTGPDNYIIVWRRA